jgi:DNA-directed RNA polymerase subunit RPC12/RpoP
METVKEYKCAKCGAIVWKGEHKEYMLNCPPYCPHCGALLTLKRAKVAVELSDLNNIEKNVIKLASNIKYSYKPPYARVCDGYNFDTINRILCPDFLEKTKITKKKADTFMYSIFGLIGVCFLAVIVFGCIAIFGNKSKTGVEIVKDEATGKYGIYNHDKDIQTVPFAYDTIAFESDYRAYFLLSGIKFGVADSTGNITIPCEMDSICPVGNDMAIMYRNGMQGVWHRDGHIIIPCENEYVFWEKKPKGDFDTPYDGYIGNIIPIKRSSNYGWDLYDKFGRRINLQTYQEAIQTGTQDMIKVKYNGYYGLVNAKGEEVIKCKAKWISRFQEDIAFIYYIDSKYLYAIDTSGNNVFSISKDYKTQWPIIEGLFARMDNNGKIGYYNKKGKLVIPHKFEQARKGDNLVSPNFQGDSARIS